MFVGKASSSTQVVSSLTLIHKGRLESCSKVQLCGFVNYGRKKFYNFGPRRVALVFTSGVVGGALGSAIVTNDTMPLTGGSGIYLI
jgi:hypothetical protein